MKQVISAVALLAILAVPALGAWSEDFQSYTLGNKMAGEGGWAGWDGGAAQAVVTGDHPKFAGDQAVKMYSPALPNGEGADDLVQQFSGYTSGQYVFTAMQYIPSVHTGTQTYFIIMNKYTPASKGWSVQMKFDYTTGLTQDDEQADPKTPVPFVYDQWKEIKVVIDLDANTHSTYYDGQLVGTADWYDTTSGDHMKSIAALDLWADIGGNGVCYDNISLVPEPATLCLLAVGALFLRRR